MFRPRGVFTSGFADFLRVHPWGNKNLRLINTNYVISPDKLETWPNSTLPTNYLYYGVLIRFNQPKMRHLKNCGYQIKLSHPGGKANSEVSYCMKDIRFWKSLISYKNLTMRACYTSHLHSKNLFLGLTRRYLLASCASFHTSSASPAFQGWVRNNGI